ncbi:unnamed protein product [Prorocentrum cordatum]|uniref:Uncharacterized protein n=2 Tax=Prorocentrum cordatum TaxID=2364126 RepID=A0ABN9WVU5_9DINO|nr:unnamed protein product [Polarella glacialis]
MLRRHAVPAPVEPLQGLPGRLEAARLEAPPVGGGHGGGARAGGRRGPAHDVDVQRDPRPLGVLQGLLALAGPGGGAADRDLGGLRPGEAGPLGAAGARGRAPGAAEVCVAPSTRGVPRLVHGAGQADPAAGRRAAGGLRHAGRVRPGLGNPAWPGDGPGGAPLCPAGRAAVARWRASAARGPRPARHRAGEPARGAAGRRRRCARAPELHAPRVRRRQARRPSSLRPRAGTPSWWSSSSRCAAPWRPEAWRGQPPGRRGRGR